MPAVKRSWRAQMRKQKQLTLSVNLVWRFVLASAVLIPVSSSLTLSSFAQETLSGRMNQIENFVASHCLECHDGDEAEADFDLAELDYSVEQFESRDFDSTNWEKMLRRLETRQMPPSTASRPSEEEYVDIINAFSKTLGAHAQQHPRPGRVGFVRRLTRIEYQNSIRDLLAIHIDASEFLPMDESSHGFDNITVENISPVLMNRYLTAAQKISRLAMGSTGNGPSGVTIRLPADRSQEEHVVGLPFGTRGGTIFEQQFPQTGEYEIELKLARDRDEKIEGLGRKHEIDILLDRAQVHQFTIEPPKKEGEWKGQDFTYSDSHLKTRIKVEAGTHQVGITFPKTFSSLIETKRQPFDANFNRHRHPRKTPAIYQVSILGPFSPSGRGETKSRKLVYGQHSPDDVEDRASAVEAAKPILNDLLRRAYRRPVTAADLEVPLSFFESGFADSDFEGGIELALTSILVNPNFLFRIEEDHDVPLGEAFALADIELANRLSFFIWSSPPDETLLSLAEQNKLSDDAVLQAQVKRMLADERSSSLTHNFAAQWLYLRNLESITPDLRQFPDFDDNLRQSFRGETEHLFSDIVKHDKSVLGLIKSDFAFLNQRLAIHYDVPNITGSHFRKVKFKSGSQLAEQRGGILRNGSVLMVTSYATRTSPTIRGNWILENIIGTPAPPPPPNVPNLKENTTLEITSVRERLAQHRKNPACASCHDLIDPVGFSLENYDAVGRWRDFEETLGIDSVGKLPDGSVANSAAELEAGILKRPENFVRTLTEKLLTFSIGRSVEPWDGPEIRKIVAASAEQDFRFSSIVEGIVMSKPFRMRTKE